MLTSWITEVDLLTKNARVCQINDGTGLLELCPPTHRSRYWNFLEVCDLLRR